jgi:cell division protein FtsW
MLISRSDRGVLASWWFTVDWLLMSAVLLLMAAGAMFSLAASPPVAARIGLDSFHFFIRQLVFLAPAIAVMVAVSFLKPRMVWRVSFIVYLIGLGLMAAAMRFGPEIKGAHRWIDMGPFNLQPSELVKPAFVVSASWLMVQGLKQPGVVGQFLPWALFVLFLGLLLMQPDFGQAVLVCAVWGVMLLVGGIKWRYVGGLALLGLGGAVAAYNTLPHVASRVNRFISPDKGDTFQVDTATRAFEHGGLFGTGPGGGSAKRILPDAHTDFIFAVIGEEFGFVACAALIGLVMFIVVRVLRRSLAAHDPFAVLAMSGLITIFGLQAVINMAVNVSLMPAKGMTLPFISYGGSSLISMAFGIGLVLALGRSSAKTTMLPGQ